MYNTNQILFIIQSLGSGGAERQISYLAVQLAEKGYKVEVLYYIKKEFYLPFLKEHSVKATYLKEASRPKSRFFVLRQYIKDVKPDTIITYSVSPGMIACALKLLGGKFKLIVSERNTTQKLNKREKLKFFLCRWADYIVPNSQSQGNFIASHFPKLEHKVRVINNYIDIKKFQPYKTIQKIEDETHMICVGRIFPQKNLIRFIYAIDKVLKGGYKIKVDWFGKDLNDKYSQEVHQLVETLDIQDNFCFHAPSTMIHEEYVKADVFCLPSIYEGFPNVLCEAMSCGLPILCSRVCDNGFIVYEGDNGFLFDPLRVDDMVRTIKKFLELRTIDKEMMAKKSRERALSLFSGEKFINSYMKLINY